MDRTRRRAQDHPRVLGPLADFLAVEITGAVILLLATAAALTKPLLYH